LDHAIDLLVAERAHRHRIRRRVRERDATRRILLDAPDFVAEALFDQAPRRIRQHAAQYSGFRYWRRKAAI
jgi:hypothetical protein